MNYLTRQDILDLHGYVIERYGGRLGIASQDRLISAVDAPRQTMFGGELYADLPSKAAALAFHLTKSRPFRSGNEATALLATLRLLDLNGVQVRDVEALAQQITQVSRSRQRREGLEDWLRDYLVPSAPAPH